MSFILKYKWYILGTLVAILVFVLYGSLKKDSPASSNGIEEQIVSIPGSDSTAGTNSNPAAGFILQLAAIQNVNFNTNFFNDPVYKELVDFSRDLGSRERGRQNPFLEIGVEGKVFEPVNNPVNTNRAPGNSTQAGNPEDQGFVQTSEEDN